MSEFVYIPFVIEPPKGLHDFVGDGCVSRPEGTAGAIMEQFIIEETWVWWNQASTREKAERGIYFNGADALCSAKDKGDECYKKFEQRMAAAGWTGLSRYSANAPEDPVYIPAVLSVRPNRRRGVVSYDCGGIGWVAMRTNYIKRKWLEDTGLDYVAEAQYISSLYITGRYPDDPWGDKVLKKYAWHDGYINDAEYFGRELEA